MPNNSRFGNTDPESGVLPCPLNKPSQATEPVHWIEIELLGEDDSPIPEEEYEVTLTDGHLIRGFLDESGWARIDGIENPGECQISFPRLDRDAWSPDTKLGPRKRHA
jgi:hypothetical protein